MKQTFLTQDKNLVADVLEQAPWGILLCSESGEINVANAEAAAILGAYSRRDCAASTLLGQRISDLVPGIELQILGEQQIEMVDQKSATLQIQLSKFEDGGESCLALYIESPHRRLDRERLLERQASTDELSDLSNRRAFQRKIERLQDRALSLALFDVDHFKNVNDKHGHLAGDDLIRLIGRLLKAHFPEPSHLGSRMGGDEFSVLIETSSPEEFVAQIENFRQQLSRTLVPGTSDLVATVSCGAVISLELGVSSRTLLTVADQELYRAKDSGRNKLSWRLLKPRE